MKVVHVVNDIGPTSNSVKIAENIARHTAADVGLISFYDSAETLDETATPESIDITCLDASSRFDWHAFAKLRTNLQEREADLLHTHHNAVGSLARLSCIGLDIQVVNTEHRSHSSFSTPQMAINTVSYPLVDAMVANSKHTEASFTRTERRLLRGKVCEVIYNGIDVEWVSNAQPERPPDTPDGPLVTNVARMIEEKNQQRLVRAFSRVLDSNPQATLMIVGDGPEKVAIESQARSCGVRDAVCFTGEVDRDTVYSILNASSVFVIPSITEGFCVAAAEAMAAGLPVVASDIGVLHEVVGDSGTFVDPEDATDIATGIKSLLSNQKRREKLGSQAGERAATRFPVQRTAKEYHALYNRLDETANSDYKRPKS